MAANRSTSAKNIAQPLIRPSTVDTGQADLGNLVVHLIGVDQKTTEWQHVRIGTPTSMCILRCVGCALKSRCTAGKERRVRRWKHEHVVDAMKERLASNPDAMNIRRRTVEQPFGTLKTWMGHTHFLTKGIEKVSTEMSLAVLAYNLKRMISIMGVKSLIATVRA